jgi:acetyl-CoA C-acetyltransferase
VSAVAGKGSGPGPTEPVIVLARRTPITDSSRAAPGPDAAGLGGAVLAALREELRSLTGQDRIDDVVLGNCCGPGGDVARVAVLTGGLGPEVPAVTVDRQCGSGLEAIRLGAALVACGNAQVVLAGGAESASTAPLRLHRPAPGSPAVPYDRAPFAPEGFADPEMGSAADDLAARYWIPRDRQDAYAARSHARAVAARRSGTFDAELVVPAGSGTKTDPRPRPGLQERTLARFRPAFTVGGTVTAGNSCGINDGAGAVALVREDFRARHSLPGLRVIATAVAGVDPALPGLGAPAAVQELLRRTGLGVQDIEVFEITEAFAAQVLAFTDALGLDPLGADADRVCPDGGAIALGHPWGASGALLVVRLFSRLVRAGRPPTGRGAQAADGGCGRFGVATCAIGGGQGVAVLVERVG